MRGKKYKKIKAEHWTKDKTVTLTVVAFVVTVVLVYDLLVVLFANDPNATVSNTVYQASKRAPIIAFLFGVLCGHLFWPISRFREPVVLVSNHFDRECDNEPGRVNE